MPKTTMHDLQTHLFAQLERLNDDQLEGEDLDREIRRTEAICKISGQAIDGFRVHVDAYRASVAAGDPDASLPPMLPRSAGRKK